MRSRSWAATAATAAMVVALVAVVFVVLVLAPGDEPETGDPATSSTTTDAGTSSTSASAPTPRPTRTTRTIQPTAPGEPTTVCVPQQSTTDLRVVSYNIHSARPYDGGARLSRVADEIARMDPDVVLLQEVDRGREWTGRVDMPAVLAARLDMGWTFGANVRRSATNLYGTAILSRFPITGSKNTLLPRPGATQQRGLLSATLDVDGVPFTAYNTHLEATSSSAREAQMRAIVPILRADDGPKVLGGDLNSAPGSAALTLARTELTDTWGVLGSGSGFTAPAGNPRIRIDYLLFGDGDGADVSPLAVRVDTTRVSDHFALVADYRLVADEGEICVPVFPTQGGTRR